MKIVRCIHGKLEFCPQYLSVNYRMADIWLSRSWSRILQIIPSVECMWAELVNQIFPNKETLTMDTMKSGTHVSGSGCSGNRVQVWTSEKVSFHNWAVGWEAGANPTEVSVNPVEPMLTRPLQWWKWEIWTRWRLWRSRSSGKDSKDEVQRVGNGLDPEERWRTLRRNLTLAEKWVQ